MEGGGKGRPPLHYGMDGIGQERYNRPDSIAVRVAAVFRRWRTVFCRPVAERLSLVVGVRTTAVQCAEKKVIYSTHAENAR